MRHWHPGKALSVFSGVCLLGDPVPESVFAALMTELGPFETAPSFAVAVSGGRDSMALLHMMVRWVSLLKGHVCAVTVDHGLRPAAADEIACVARYCKDLGCDHHSLTLPVPLPLSGIQAQARISRYQVMHALCRAHGLIHLCTAHHADDVQETIRMRAARPGLQPLGLAGISLVDQGRDIRVLRPLLHLPRSTVTQYCQAHHIPWMDDPSNWNRQFERVRVRLDHAPSKCVTPVRPVDGLNGPRHPTQKSPSSYFYASYSKEMCERCGLESAASRWLVRCATPTPVGTLKVTLSQSDLDHIQTQAGSRMPEIITIWVALRWSFHWVRGVWMAGPSWTAIQRMCLTPTGTLAGVSYRWDGYDLILVREARFLPEPKMIASGQMVRWDSRFSGQVRHSGTIRPVGRLSRRSLSRLQGACHIAPWPFAVRQTWPGVWNDAGELIGAAVLTDGRFQPKPSSPPVLIVRYDPEVSLIPRPFKVFDPTGYFSIARSSFRTKSMNTTSGVCANLDI